MRALKLDYRRKSPWPRMAGWAGLLLACLALVGQGWQYRQLALAIETGEAELARFGSYHTAGDLRPDKRLEAEMGDARAVLIQLDVPWDELFDAVETSTRGEVALLGIEPEPKQEQVRIIGEAKDYPAVLDYVRRLEESAPLKSVYLQNHEVQAQDQERPVHFVLGATWKERP